MANIAIGDMVIKRAQEGEFMDMLLITPNTADTGDTVDVSTLLQGRTIMRYDIYDSTDALEPGRESGTYGAIDSSSIVTLGGAGNDAPSDSSFAIALRLATLT